MILAIDVKLTILSRRALTKLPKADAKANAKANADYAYAIEVEGMLARLDKRGSVAGANTEHAYPVEVEGMLSKLERRGSVTQANTEFNRA